jgi:hypothetical protein
MAANGGKSTKGEKQEKRLDFWANILAGFAIISAVTAVMFALLWGITSSYASYENYKVLEEIDMGNGQRFKVEYPGLVLADDTPANLIITLNAPIDNNKNVKITFPEEIRLSDYRENASVRLIEKQFTSSAGKDDRVIKFIFYHSKTVMSNLLYGNQVVKIESAYLPNGILNVKIPMETNRWAGIRSFVNNSVEDKSPLILLASGLISWAGTYLLQFIKDKRERQKDFEQQQREDRKKYEEDLLSSFQKNPVLAVRGFIEDCEKEGYEEYKDIYLKLEIAGCHRSMIENIFALWHAGGQSEAKLVIKDLVSLKNKFSTPDHFSKEIRMIEILHEIALLPDTASIKEEDLKEILDAYVLWREALNLILIPIIRKAVEVPTNLPNMKKVFGADGFIGIPLLRDASIQNKLIWYWEDPERVLTEEEFNTLVDDQRKRVKDERSSAAKDLYRRLSTKPNWKPLWQQKETRRSERMSKWLKSNDPEFTDFSFGEELAELDGEALKQKKEKTESFERWAGHPSLENIWQAKPLLLFAGEGMGKTASAYYLVNICRNPKSENYSGAFPVYATFQNNLDAKEWIVASVAQALVDFISENPRRFLDAELAQRVAMGRMILFYVGSLDRVKVVFKRSGHTTNDDWSQILVQLKELVPQSTLKRKITDTDVKDLLDKARPDGFDRLFFILDINSMSGAVEKSEVIKELGKLILPLLQVNFFIKAFLPVEFKATFDKTLLEIFGVDLEWNESLLQEMLKLRFGRFEAVCDNRRTVRAPFKLIAAASSGSPRKAIRYGNALMRYAEENLGDFQKLDASAFEMVRVKLINSGLLPDIGGEA